MWGQSSNVYSKLPYSNQLLCWYSADKLFGEGSTLPADASAITFVSDLSGNSNHLTQSDPTYQPTFRTNVINGLPVMRFATSQLGSRALGNNKYVAETASIGSMMMFAVALVTTPNSLSSIMTTCIGTSYSYRGSLYFLNNTYAAGGRRLDANGFATASGGTVTNGVPVLISAWFDYSSAIATVYGNGVSQGVSNPFQTAGVTSATSGRGISLGMSLNTPSFPLIGDIAEALIYPSMTSTANREAIELYLRTKYAIV